MKRLMLAAALAAMIFDSAALAETRQEREARKQEEKELGSLYLRCDGKPNNMTDGESFARFLGAITLLGIFAKSPEAADPSKRLFGEEGVGACTQLIDGEDAEKNGVRRLPLILARALHQIEAKNYEAAIADVDKARGEASDIGLTGNPYFDRSMGLSFDNIEAEARLRLGDPLGAQKVSLGRLAHAQYSFVPLVFARDYSDYMHELTPLAEKATIAQIRITTPFGLGSYADKLEEVGRFAEAAQKREALIEFVEGLKPENVSSIYYARAAVSHALAGEWDRAPERADFARANLAQRRSNGVAEDNESTVIEVLDLYDLLRLAHGGDTDKARLQFAARSQWLGPSFGDVMEANRRLREGATPDQLFGALSKTPEQMWEERRDNLMATKLQKDTDNKTLFNQIVPYAKIDEFEAQSKTTWRVEKSKMMLKKPSEKTGLWGIYTTGNPQTRFDSVVLHAALQAQARGKQGFVISMTSERSLTIGVTRFLDRDELKGDDSLFVDAADAISELREVIPDPDELKRRRKARR